MTFHCPAIEIFEDEECIAFDAFQDAVTPFLALANPLKILVPHD